jgi:hypothetical protein
MMETMGRRTDPTGTLPLAALSRADRHTLGLLEMDWPDSIGLMVRVALHARMHDPIGADPQAGTLAMVRAGICAYRRSWEGRDDDTERFAAFVDGITHALPREQQHCVAKALSATQRRVLARRFPPGGAPDVG